MTHNAKAKEVLTAEVLDAEGRSLAFTPQRGLTAPAPSSPAERYRRHVGKQVFVELFSGTRYTGRVLGIEGDALILDTATIRVAAIVVLSDVLLPMIGVGRK